MYRKAKDIHNQKINNNTSVQSVLENTRYEDENEEDDDGEYKEKEFFEFYAVPSLMRIQEGNSDEDSNVEENEHKDSFIKHSGPLTTTRPLKFARKKEKHYTGLPDSQRFESQLDESDSDSSSSSKNSDGNGERKLKTLEKAPGGFNSNIERELIGEVLFQSTNLRGWKRLIYFYLFIIAWMRFICFRTKKPVKKAFILVLMFITLLLIDIIITFNLFLHMKAESRGERTFSGIGIYYFFLYPGIAIISPLCGFASQFLCKPKVFKFYVMMNSISIMVNLSITFIFQIIHEDRFYYVMEVLIVITVRVLQNNLANYQIAIFEISKSLIN
jgi:hypothetical protein